MEKTSLKIKYKNTLQHLIILLLGIIFLIVGLAGYFITDSQKFFYLIAFSNILIVWVLYKSQIKKNHVMYDAVFVKYRLHKDPVERIKTDDISKVERKDDSILVHLKNQEITQIDLEEFSDESIQEFERILNFYTN